VEFKQNNALQSEILKEISRKRKKKDEVKTEEQFRRMDVLFFPEKRGNEENEPIGLEDKKQDRFIIKSTGTGLSSNTLEPPDSDFFASTDGGSTVPKITLSENI